MDDNNFSAPSQEAHTSGLPAPLDESSPYTGLVPRPSRKSVLLLVATGATYLALGLSPLSVPGILSSIMAFPFAQLGRGLRWLSLPGGVGNIFAIVLYAAFCLLPTAGLLLIRKKHTEDILLPISSAVLFVVMYYMINPGLITMAAVARPFEQAIMGGVVYSLLMAYGVLRALRYFSTAPDLDHTRYLAALLHVLNMLFVLAIGLVFARMVGAISALRMGDAGLPFDMLQAPGLGGVAAGQGLAATYVFIILGHAITALPHGLNIWVIFSAQALLTAFLAGPYSQETLTAAKVLSRICGLALALTVLTHAGFNLLQLIFISRLATVSTSIILPVTPVLFVLGALLLTRLIAASKQIKDENDQFV